MIIRRATLRLTLLYSAVIIGVAAVFALAVAVYAMAAFDVEVPGGSEELLDQANVTLRTALIIGFAAAVLLAPPLSYLLARNALRPVRASLEAQQAFVDDASHELRTPIAVAQGELELALMQPRDGAVYRESIANALDAIGELDVLTTDLLLLARDEHASGIATEMAVQEFAALALAATRSEVRDRVELRTTGRPIHLRHPELLARATANLLENAGKFSTPPDLIDAAFVRDDAGLRITITDRGIGMSEADAARAFERFWRADAARSAPGHGIGLSLVRRIAQLHGGRATLRSAPGRGTAATIDIPDPRPGNA